MVPSAERSSRNFKFGRWKWNPPPDFSSTMTAKTSATRLRKKLFWVEGSSQESRTTVSYTHLDVYKRQVTVCLLEFYYTTPVKWLPPCCMVPAQNRKKRLIWASFFYCSSSSSTYGMTLNLAFPAYTIIPRVNEFTNGRKSCYSCLLYTSRCV